MDWKEEHQNVLFPEYIQLGWLWSKCYWHHTNQDNFWKIYAWLCIDKYHTHFLPGKFYYLMCNKAEEVSLRLAFVSLEKATKFPEPLTLLGWFKTQLLVNFSLYVPLIITLVVLGLGFFLCYGSIALNWFQFQMKAGVICLALYYILVMKGMLVNDL